MSTANSCRVVDCTAPAKDNHQSLHAASDEQLGATPTTWPSYSRNQTELARRSAR